MKFAGKWMELENIQTQKDKQDFLKRKREREKKNSPSLLLYLPPCVLRLTGNFYILSSWRSGIFSSCCLALDSSSSFPCPAFRAIAKSMIKTLKEEVKNSVNEIEEKENKKLEEINKSIKESQENQEKSN
ncbi:hypothetical protein STEG23_006313, partial [Scotinomys teguina]